MAQTLVSLYVHIIFSTKHRADLILPAIENDLFAYLGGIANNNQAKLLAAGGTENHVHLLVSTSKNIALSELVGDLKRDSSKWIKTKGKEFENFHWQDGYGAFTVSASSVPDVIAYIRNQREHHRTISLQEEYLLSFG